MDQLIPGQPPSPPSPDRASPSLYNDYDIILYTDGAGLDDYAKPGGGFGGFGAIAVSNKHRFYISSCGGSTHTSTNRGEFLGVLTALRSVMHENHWTTKAKLNALAQARPTVLVVSDRDSIVGSINNVYKREADQDLWVQFEWYEKYFLIEAVYTPRDTISQHKIADKLASGAREVIYEFHKRQSEALPL